MKPMRWTVLDGIYNSNIYKSGSYIIVSGSNSGKLRWTLMFYGTIIDVCATLKDAKQAANEHREKGTK